MPPWAARLVALDHRDQDQPVHGHFAWASLLWVGIADGFVRLVASGTIHDQRFF